MRFTLLTTLLFLSFSLKAENYLLYVGGGGEPQGNSTIFDPYISPYGDLSNNGWKAEVLFNGGHKKTEAILEKSFGEAAKNNKPFESDRFLSMINNYKEKIKNGEIKSGDKILLSVLSHGHEASSAEVTHSVSSSSGSYISLDPLEELAELANEKNIKLAVIDHSCFAGNSLKLRNTNTCVITMSGSEHPTQEGPLTFISNFTKNLKTGKNLEDIYLESFKSAWGMTMPAISSPIGHDLYEELYSLMAPYMQYYIKGSDYEKFQELIQEDANQCTMEDDFKGLMNIIDKIAPKDSKKLKEALNNYHAFIMKMKADYQNLKAPELKNKVKFCSGENQQHCLTYSEEDLLTLKFDGLKRVYKQMIDTGIPASIEIAQAMLENVDKIEKYQKEALKKYPDMKKKLNFYEHYAKLGKKTGRLALYVTWAANDFYYSQYLKRAKQDQRPNPCKDFVL